MKTQSFQRELAASMARVPEVVENLRALKALRADGPGVAASGTDATLGLAAVRPGENAALEDWKALRR